MLFDAEAKAPSLTNRKLATEVRAATRDLILTTGDPTNAKAVKDMFTIKTIARSEVNNVLKEHPNLPNAVRDHILNAHDEGRLVVGDSKRAMKGVRSVDEVMSEGDTKLMGEYLKSASYSIDQFQALTDVLTKLEVKNPEEMAHLLYNVNHASMIYGKAPEEILAQATIFSQGMAKPERMAYIDKIFADIQTFR